MGPENQHSKHFPKLFRYCWSRGHILGTTSMFYVAYFAGYSDKTLDVNDLEEQGSILAHSFKRVSPSQQGRHGGTEQSTSWQLGNREMGIQKRARARCHPHDMVTFPNWALSLPFYTLSKMIGYYEELTTGNRSHS